MKQYLNYVFDLYGTLVDICTDEGRLELWEKMSLFLGYYGAVYEPRQLQKAYLDAVREAEEQICRQNMTVKGAVQYAHEAYPEIPLEEVFQKLYRQKGIEAEQSLVLHTGQMFRVFSTRHIRLYDNAKELLCALRAADKKVYLLSNAQRIFTEYELRFLGIADCFDGILISSDYGFRKPDGRFFRLLTKRYGVDLRQSLMIGNDLAADIAGAWNVGMDGFYIHSAISPAQDKEEMSGWEKGGYSPKGSTHLPKEEQPAFYYRKNMNLLALQSRLLKGMSLATLSRLV